MTRSRIGLIVSVLTTGVLCLASDGVGQERQPGAGRAAPPARARNLIEVASPVAGVVVVVGSELGTEEVPADQVITVKIDGKEVRFRRLKEGDQVKEGQLLARVDDRLARLAMEIHGARIAACQAEAHAAEKTLEEARQRFKAITKAREIVPNAVAEEDFRGAFLTVARYEGEVQVKKVAVRLADLESQKAALLVQMHQVRSPVNGVIRAINRQRGEAVRNLDPVIQIEIAGAAK